MKIIAGLSVTSAAAVAFFALSGLWWALIGPNSFATDFMCFGMPRDCEQVRETAEWLHAWRDQGGTGFPPDEWRPEH